MGPFRVQLLAAALSLGLLPTAPASAIDLVLVYDDLGENPSYDPNGTRLMAIAQAAALRWERLIPSAGTHIIDVSWSDLGEGQLGLWKFDPFGNNNVYFDASNPAWFFDPTPQSDGEFEFGDPLEFENDGGSLLATDDPDFRFFDGTDPPPMLEISYFGIGKSGNASTNTDLLSVVLHEVGHELGVAGDFLSGRYPLDPDHVLGIQGIEAVEGNCEGAGGENSGYCEEHGHVAPPSALMSPSTGNGVRTLPSAMDVLVAARDSNYESVDLARKFSGRSGSWSDASDWIGGRVPDDDDDVILAHGGTTTLTGSRTADSVWIDDDTTLNATGDLAIDHELVIGTHGELRSAFGSEISAQRFEARDGSETLLTGGHLVFGGGLVAEGATVSGRGILETNGTLVVEGAIDAEGGDLRLDGNGAIHLDRVAGSGFGSGELNAIDGNLGLDIGFTAQSDGRIRVGAGHNLTAVRDLIIPNGIELSLGGDASSPAILNSVGSGIQVTVHDLSAGRNGEIVASDVRLQGTVAVSDPTSVLTLSSGLRTTLADTFFFGNGTVVQDSDLWIEGNVRIRVDTFDWGNSTSGQINDLRVGAGSALEIDVESLGSVANVFRGELEIDGGVLEITTPGPWELAAPRTIGSVTTPGGTLAMTHGGGADPIVRGSPFTARNLLVVAGGNAFIESDLTVAPTASMAVLSNASLFLAGNTTLDGGSYTGLGSLVQRGDIDVVSDTRIGTSTFNWGNSVGGDFNTLTVESGAILTVASQGTGDPSNTFRGGVVLNGGQLVVDTDLPWTLPKSSAFLPGGNLALNFDGEAPRVSGQPLTVGGTIAVTGGAAHIDSDLTMFDGSIDVAAGATLNLNGANVYRGSFAGDGIYRHNGSALLGSSLAIPHLLQNGRLTVINPNGEALLDTQTLVFEADSDTRVFSDLRIRGDALLMPDAGFTGSKTLVIDAAGSLSGGEDLGVSLRNEGVLRPGFSPGALNIGGDFATRGTLEIELGGTLAGLTHDAIAVDGDIALDGTLALILYGGFAPASGDSFDILDWTGVLGGAFSNFAYPLGSGPTQWDFSDLYTTGELRFVPEPGTAVMLALGLAALRIAKARRSPARG